MSLSRAAEAAEILRSNSGRVCQSTTRCVECGQISSARRRARADGSARGPSSASRRCAWIAAFGTAGWALMRGDLAAAERFAESASRSAATPDSPTRRCSTARRSPTCASCKAARKRSIEMLEQSVLANPPASGVERDGWRRPCAGSVEERRGRGDRRAGREGPLRAHRPGVGRV